VISLADNSKFFAGSAIGIACPGGFYQLADGAISLVPLTPEHRQRVMLPFTPTQQPTPMFNAFLHETFASETVGEEEQQITLVQEIAGAILLALMPKHQRPCSSTSRSAVQAKGQRNESCAIWSRTTS